jgi:hypothetical protein
VCVLPCPLDSAEAGGGHTQKKSKANPQLKKKSTANPNPSTGKKRLAFARVRKAKCASRKKFVLYKFVSGLMGLQAALRLGFDAFAQENCVGAIILLRGAVLRSEDECLAVG